MTETERCFVYHKTKPTNNRLVRNNNAERSCMYAIIDVYA